MKHISDDNVGRHGFCVCLLLVCCVLSVLLAGLPLNVMGAAEELTVESQQNKKISGRILDEAGEPMAGATIQIDGATNGVITGVDGSFVLEKVPEDGKIIVSFLGMETQTVDVAGKTEFTIVMVPKKNELEEVTVVAFSKQKKSSVLSSITTVKPDELKAPTSNLTTALAGRVAGLISYQQSGEPGQDNAQFFIRGITTFGAKAKADPLILIDGIELSADDLARLNTDDIASFSIMKDATATALYGARGANGVILVTTKEGREGKAQVSVRFENSFSAPTRKVELADPITYMKLHNESVSTRNPLGILPYTTEKITMTERGLYPNLYPATDWYDYLFNDVTINQRVNMSVSGGGQVARYYIAASFAKDNGNLKMDKRNNFNSNIDLKKYSVRSSININITKTTEAVIRVNGTFDDYTGPLQGGSGLYNLVMQSNPVLFKPYYEPDEATRYNKHILFGNYGEANYINPYAEMLKGYKDWSKNLMLAQFELNQDFNFVTKGLTGRVMFNTTRYSEYDVSRYYDPYYYNIKPFDVPSDSYELSQLHKGEEFISYAEGGKWITSTLHMEAALDYNRTFGEKHNTSGLLVFLMDQRSTANGGSLQASLPARNLGLSGRFAYNYDNRYFLEFNFGYNGSERFAKNNRFGFFPAIGGAWYISNEKFFAPLKKVITQLKFKGTYGLVGNDAIGDTNDRFFYLSQIEMKNNNRTTVFGEQLSHSILGVETVRYANDKIGWEVSYKTNLGIEMSLFDKFTVLADFFHDKRTNILINRTVPASMGLSASNPTQANLGVAVSRGVDIEANYQHSITPDLWITGRGTFTYAVGKVKEWEEPDYSSTPWKSAVNQPIGQVWGYIAERLFVDDEEIANSPVQMGEYKAGDIKYRDVNGDGKITPLDMVPIGFPTTPQINYGFGASLGYKWFDFSFFFQGSARQSFWIDTNLTWPFVDSNTGDAYKGNNALLKAYADSHWSEANPDIYATWPRLANYKVENNEQWSTWFMQDASFIRLKSAEIGFTLPQKWLQKAKIENLRLYVSGTNLLTWSRFKLWDPEMAGNGLGYPVQRVFNIGVNLSF